MVLSSRPFFEILSSTDNALPPLPDMLSTNQRCQSNSDLNTTAFQIERLIEADAAPQKGLRNFSFDLDVHLDLSVEAPKLGCMVPASLMTSFIIF